MGRERRRHTRYVVRLRAAFQGREGAVPATVVDVSRSGLRVRVSPAALGLDPEATVQACSRRMASLLPERMPISVETPDGRGSVLVHLVAVHMRTFLTQGGEWELSGRLAEPIPDLRPLVPNATDADLPTGS